MLTETPRRFMTAVAARLRHLALDGRRLRSATAASSLPISLMNTRAIADNNCGVTH
jgi:hypothetical protein